MHQKEAWAKPERQIPFRCVGTGLFTYLSQRIGNASGLAGAAGIPEQPARTLSGVE